MTENDAYELAYKNGYEKGYEDCKKFFIEELKKILNKWD